MAVSFESSDSQTIRFTMRGHYSFEEVLTAIQDATSPACPDHKVFGLMDIRASKEVRTTEELRLLARRLAESGVFSGFAVVAEQDVRYGMARMLSVFADEEGLQLEAFRQDDPEIDGFRAVCSPAESAETSSHEDGPVRDPLSRKK